MRYFLCLLVALISSNSWAELKLGTQLSTAGIGIELGYDFNRLIGVRLGNLIGNVDFDFDAEDSNGIEGDELHYENHISLRNVYLLADWHPRRSRFRLTGGLLINNSEANIVTRCEATSPVPGTASCEFGNSRFSPAVLGEIHTDISFDTVAPYIGFGWGGKSKHQFGFNFDLGLAYLGSATVKLNSTGTCGDSEACSNEIKKEEQEIQSELDDYRILPIARLGLSYSF